MKRLLVFLFSLLLGMASCRKDDFVRPSNHYIPSANPGTNWSEILTVGSRVPCFGFLMCSRLSGSDSSISATTTSVAYFSDTLTHYPNSARYVKVSHVDINGDVFKFSGYQYSDTLHNNFQPTIAWTVTGLGMIPSFYFTNYDPFPAYSGFYQLPDTVHKNQALVFFLNGLVNTDTAMILLTDGNKAISNFIKGTASWVTFTIPLQQQLSATPNGELWVFCTNNNLYYVNGQAFCFSTNQTYHKKICITL